MQIGNWRPLALATAGVALAAGFVGIQAAATGTVTTTSITGTLQLPGGDKITSADITVQTASGLDYISDASTYSDPSDIYNNPVTTWSFSVDGVPTDSGPYVIDIQAHGQYDSSYNDLHSYPEGFLSTAGATQADPATAKQVSTTGTALDLGTITPTLGYRLTGTISGPGVARNGVLGNLLSPTGAQVAGFGAWGGQISADGSFFPGTYKIAWAHDSGYSTVAESYYKGKLWGAGVPGATTIEISNADVAITDALAPGAKITGKYLNPAGQGMYGCSIHAVPVSSKQSTRNAGRGLRSSGAFTVPGLSAGSYRVAVNGNRYCPLGTLWVASGHRLVATRSAAKKFTVSGTQTLSIGTLHSAKTYHPTLAVAPKAYDYTASSFTLTHGHDVGLGGAGIWTSGAIRWNANNGSNPRSDVVSVAWYLNGNRVSTSSTYHLPSTSRGKKLVMKIVVHNYGAGVTVHASSNPVIVR